jgi:hypothetical protein
MISSARPAATLAAPAQSRPPDVRSALGQQRGRHRCRGQRHRDQRQEHPGPAERVRDEPAEDGAAHHPDVDRGGHPAEHGVAVSALLRHRGGEGEGGRDRTGGAEAGEGAAGYQRDRGAREAREQRAGGEGAQAGHQETPPAEQVGGASASGMSATYPRTPSPRWTRLS